MKIACIINFIQIYISKLKRKRCMNKYTWIEKFGVKGFVAPFVIEKDSEYFVDLNNRLTLFIEEISKSGANDSFIEAMIKYRDAIIKSIDLYYQGEIIDAHTIISDLLECFNEDDKISVSNINNSIAFWGQGDEVQFFRARLTSNVSDFPAKEMLHIPFGKREIVKSERFSIPGLPCLYLANTSYACWIEMGRPADYKFNVSPVLLDNTQKIFNLAVSVRDLKYRYQLWLDGCGDINEEDILVYLKLIMLNIATSYKVNQGERNFKSEYILPQMIMLACKKRGLDGISYYSKQVNDELFANVAGVNLVLFATYQRDAELSEICNHIIIGDSFNYSMFKQLSLSLKYKKYSLRIDTTGRVNNIGTFDRQFPYRETEFYEFDQYIFANWDKNIDFNEL